MKKLKEEELVSRAQDIFSRASTWRGEAIVPRWKKDNNLYNGKFEVSDKQKSDTLIGKGRLFIPKTYAHTQRVLVDALDAIFFDPEEIVGVGSWKNMPTQTRQLVKTLLNYRLNGHPINFYQEAYESVLDALKNKVGLMKVYPKIDEIRKNDGEGNIEATKKYAPIICSLPYEDVFFSPEATWKDYWKFPMVHRMKKSLDYLKRRKYKNLDQLAQVASSAETDEIKEQRSQDTGSPFSPALKNDKSQGIYIFEFWDLLDVDGDGYLESCSYLMGGDSEGPKVLIRGVEKNTLPYMRDGEDYNRPPIIMGQGMPEPHQQMGKSMPEIMEGLQREANSIRNQRREATAMAIRSPMLVNRNAHVDLMSLVNRRISGIVMGDDISEAAIRQLNVKDPSAASLQDQQQNDRDLYETTSITPPLLGMPASKEETATAVVKQEFNANKKIQLIVKNLAYTLFLPAFECLLRLEQEYCEDDFIMKVTGRKLGWRWISDNVPPREFIQGDFELTVSLGVNKQMQLNRLLMIMDRANQANQSTMQMVAQGVIDPGKANFIDVTRIFQRLLPLLGEKDLSEFTLAAQMPPMNMGRPGGVPSAPRMPVGAMDGIGIS